MEESYRLYFGDLPPDWKSETPSLLYIKALAGKWFKIGISPFATTGTLGLLPPSRIDDRHILTILHAVVEPEALYIDNPRFSLTKAAMPCSATTARTGKR